MTIDNPKHRHGRPCPKCGGTVRFKKSAGCVSCNKEEGAKRRQRNPEKYNAYMRARYKTHKSEYENTRLKYEYGITLAQYNGMADKQGGKCAICRGTAKLHVDHCHTGGHVRGLLCGNCNRALGLLKDNSEALANAIAYLDQTQKATNAE